MTPAVARHVGHQMWPLVRAGDQLVIEPGHGGVVPGAVVLLAGGGAARVVARGERSAWVRGDASAYLELTALADIKGRVTAVRHRGGERAIPIDRLAGAVGLVGGALYTALLHLANVIHAPLAVALIALRLAARRPSPPAVEDERDVVWGWSMVPVLTDGELLVSTALHRHVRTGDVVLVQHPTRAVCHRVVARLPGATPTYIEKGDGHLRFGRFRPGAVAATVVAVERLDGETRTVALSGPGARAIALASLMLGLAWIPVAVAANLIANLPLFLVVAARR